MINNYDNEIEHEATTAHCTKCGEEIVGSEDSICGACSGEELMDMSGASDDAEYPDR